MVRKMAYYQIEGTRPLEGEVRIDGMKNSAVAIMMACVLVEDACVLENVPMIMDVIVAIETLRQMGVKVIWLEKDILEIDARGAKSAAVADELVRKMRASYYLLGAELGRFGESKIAYPGGCNFGSRPIDQHLKGLTALGATCNTEGSYISVRADALFGADITFDVTSVGATVNLLLAAAKATGQTVLHNAAREPHVGDVAKFLSACGVKIEGIGSETLYIEGCQNLHGCRYRILPDMIEAGTFLIATAATGGSVILRDVIPEHLACLCGPLEKMGAMIEASETCIKIDAVPNKASSFSIKTGPYPLFPTDLQPQFGALLACANGHGSIQECVWEHRFQYCNELKKMGADINCVSDTAYFHGGLLIAANVKAVDLRAGAAMVIAALATQGTTRIDDIYHIERGYTCFVEKLQSLGASINRIA